MGLLLLLLLSLVSFFLIVGDVLNDLIDPPLDHWLYYGSAFNCALQFESSLHCLRHELPPYFFLPLEVTSKSTSNGDARQRVDYPVVNHKEPHGRPGIYVVEYSLGVS